MKTTKYIKPLLVSIIVIGMLMAAPFLIGEEDGFSDLIPTDSLSYEFAYCFTWFWLGAIIGILCCYIFAPLFLIVHKKVIGPKMIYGIHNVEDPNPKKFKGLLKGLFPALMALNLALIFSTNEVIQPLLLLTDPDPESPINLFMGVIMLLTITTGVSMALFSTAWTLMDSGIVYSNKKKLEEKKLPPEVRSVGGWYLYLLKGYAGISVLFSFYMILSRYMAVEAGNFAGIFFFMFLPILIALIMLPSIILLEMTAEKRGKYILRIAKKYGITDEVEVKFELTKK